MINVTWDDAKEYVTWLSTLTNQPYRLLSEAEWEYAARAGTTTVFSFANVEALGEHAWHQDNSEYMTHPVGEKKPNAFGLYDMHGNAREWVEDSWHENYDGAPSDTTPWRQEDEPSRRMLRGGSWSQIGDFLARLTAPSGTVAMTTRTASVSRGRLTPPQLCFETARNARGWSWFRLVNS